MIKLLYGIATILEVLCFAGAYIINFFTHKKMGLARYVIYKNQGWRTKYPLETLTYAVAAAVLLLAVFTLLLFLRRRKQAGRLLAGMNIVMVILDIWYIGFTFCNSTDTLRAYYFMSLLFGLTAALQTAKTCAATLRYKKQK